MSPPAHALSAPPCPLGAAAALREVGSRVNVYESDAEWFKAELQPHERSLRAYFRMKFPQIAEPDDLVQESYFRILKARAAGKTMMNKVSG